MKEIMPYLVFAGLFLGFIFLSCLVSPAVRNAFKEISKGNFFGK